MKVLPQLRTMAIGGLVAIAMTTAAHATLFTAGDPGGSFDLGTGWLDQGDDRTLDIYWFVDTDFAGEDFSLSSVGDSKTLDFGEAEFTGESKISEKETVNLEITANVDLSGPEALAFASIGSVVTFLGGTRDDDIDVTVDFAPVEVDFGNTGRLLLTLSSIAFDDDYQSQDIEATFTLLAVDTPAVNDPPSTTEVPEPASLALFGLGLAGFGFMRRRQAS